eukprot:scaffold20497_cov69-Phaeocystis_antarctica.AAC.1
MNAMEIDSQYETTENACVRMILSGVNKRRRVAFSGLPSTPPTRPAGKFEPPRQGPRAGDEPPKIMLSLGRAVPASPAPTPRAPVGGAARQPAARCRPCATVSWATVPCCLRSARLGGTSRRPTRRAVISSGWVYRRSQTGRS